MTSRERVIKALNHEEPDRVPIDLGGSHCSTIHHEAYTGLVKHLKIELKEPPVIRKMSQTVNEIDETVKKRFGIDFVGIPPGPPDGSRAMGPGRMNLECREERQLRVRVGICTSPLCRGR
jgi:uroporphyrinogen decarboxylase